ncbi:MAG: hypothetical protein E7630_01020 [Ruminococcaceae bacterium]|nr:hypothetical protein [Oscillospiraceae bacterium]
MFWKKLQAKRNAVVAGWVMASLLLLAAGLCIYHVSHRELSVMLCVDGQPLCRVESQSVVDHALLLLEEKLIGSGIREETERKLSYRYVLADRSTAADAETCMELLFDLTSEHYCRAYMITVKGREIAACATYGEAEKVVEDFRTYVTERVMASEKEADLVELTTDFGIRSVFCPRERIASGKDILRLMIGSGDRYEPEDSEPSSDTRVNAPGSSSILFADKNKDFGLLRNPVLRPSGEDGSSFHVSGLGSVIEYRTVYVQTYSEIVGYDVEYVESDSLYVGQTAVVFAGEEGIAENVYRVAYSGGVEVSRTLVSSKIIVEPKNRVERIGTKAYPSTNPTGSFIWPLSDWQISSYFGLSRPGLEGKGEYHLGLDLAGPKLGEPILAADGGEVIFAGDRGSYGLLVKIRHEDNVVTYYAHMSAITVEKGDRVYQGQKIGEIGRSGVATGVHLHFEVLIDDKRVDPLKYLPKTE